MSLILRTDSVKRGDVIKPKFKVEIEKFKRTQVKWRWNWENQYTNYQTLGEALQVEINQAKDKLSWCKNREPRPNMQNLQKEY